MTADGPELPADLLALARDDLAIARMVESEGLSRVGLGFHAQQAVEKALKSVLAGQGVEFPFTHDIALLLKLCRECGLEVPHELEGADRLAPYAATVRYGLGDPATVDPVDALRWATFALEWPTPSFAAPTSPDPLPTCRRTAAAVRLYLRNAGPQV